MLRLPPTSPTPASKRQATDLGVASTPNSLSALAVQVGTPLQVPDEDTVSNAALIDTGVQLLKLTKAIERLESESFLCVFKNNVAWAGKLVMHIICF